MFHEDSRRLQDRFDTRRIADRIEQKLVSDTISEGDKAFIERLDCPRYIHRYQLVERSRFVPRTGARTPVPDWKRAEWARDALPDRDPARLPDEIP